MNTIHSNIPLKDIYYEEMDVVTKYDKGSICEEMYLLKHQRAIPENGFDTVKIFHFNVFYSFDCTEIGIRHCSKLIGQYLMPTCNNIFSSS